MKKVLFLALFVPVMGRLAAQPLQDAQKILNYERYDSAIHLMQKAIQANPNNTEAWWLLTQAYLGKDKIKPIKDSLLQLPAGNRNAPFVLCAYGYVLLQEHKKDSAAIYFNKALEETREKDPAILLAIGKAQVDAPAGDANYAIDLLNKALKKDKHNAELYVTLGNAYRKLQNGSDSYKAYQNALQQDNNCAGASFRLGKIFISQGNPEMYLKYFNDAIRSDPNYAPAWYELYFYYYFRDVHKAADYLNHYIESSDKNIKNDYLLTDLMFVSKKYEDAIRNARRLIDRQGQKADPKMYKLIAYSYKELSDSSNARDYMQQFFKLQNDTAFVIKDYETMGDIYFGLAHIYDSAARYYIKAEEMEKDSAKKIEYYKKLSEIYKKLKDYPSQAFWLGIFYHASPKATNLDLFNWGLANYLAKNYEMADSAFGIYELKYPEQEFGYYWRARNDAAMDTSMSSGLAIPHYLKLIEIAGKDTANSTNRRHLIESYGYIAAYNANSKKDYSTAIEYFEKLLSLDPQNKEAMKYIEILKKNLNKSEKNETSKAGK
ncbi:tetratricopeptide repeat protein [Flavitalea flava]